MADSSNEKDNVTEEADEAMIDDDDKTVETETVTTKTDFIEQEMTEHTIRYEIPFHKGQASKDDFQSHTKLLIKMSEAFDSTELQFVDNKNQRIKDFDDPKWLDLDYYKSHFTIHHDEAQRRTVMVHRIRSKLSIAGIKGETTVLTFLKATNTFLRAHFWQEDEVLLKDIGFLNRYIPTQHSTTFVIQDMTDRVAMKAPSFRLIHSQPRIKIADKSLKTHAFSIQVLAKDAIAMNKYLRKAYADQPLFLPYSTKKKHPDVVAKAILAQNKQISETYVIVVIGINRDVMAALESNLQELPGFIEVSDTKKTEKTGRWNILVQEKLFRKTRKAISTNITQWVRSLPAILRETIPTSFPTPQVSQKFSDEDDDSSAGQVSYMSSCAQSYGSIDENDDAYASYFEPPNETSYRSYAAVTKATPLAKTYPTTPTPETIEIREFRSIIKGLETELAVFKGMRTPSTVTEISTPDTYLTNATARMDVFEANISELKDMMENMATLIKSSQKAEGKTTINPTGAKNGHESPQSSATRKRTDTPQQLANPGFYIDENLSTQPSPSHRYDTPPYHSKKRTDTRQTPNRGDPMITQTTDNATRIQLFQESNENAYRQNRYPNHAGGSPHGYDPNRPQQLYLDNGDGSLVAVGVATANDFDEYGNIHGARPSPNQPNPSNIQRARYPYEMGQPSGQLSPAQQSQESVTGSPSQSLLAEGAKTYNA